MHKKIEVGDILLYYPSIELNVYYNGSSYVRGYLEKVHALTVYTRRARTNGAYVPGNLKNYLESLGVRTLNGYNGNIIAVGCRLDTVYTNAVGNTPAYTNECFKALVEKRETSQNKYNPELESIIERRIVNKDAKFSLFLPQRLSEIYEIPQLQELDTSVDIWA